MARHAAARRSSGTAASRSMESTTTNVGAAGRTTIDAESEKRAALTAALQRLDRVDAEMSQMALSMRRRASAQQATVAAIAQWVAQAASASAASSDEVAAAAREALTAELLAPVSQRRSKHHEALLVMADPRPGKMKQ